MKGLGVKWALAYVYIVYLFLATLPQLNTLPPFRNGIPILFLIALYLFHSFSTYGLKALRFLALGVGIGFTFEFLGVHTGFPFGRYYYTPNAGPEILGVPILIPLLWATLGYFSLSVTGQSLISSWLMVLVDVTVDPLFSKFDWHWITEGQYFGVPISNFVGWYLVSLLIFLMWNGIGRFRVNKKGTIFYAGLVITLALQDLFSGLTYPFLISLMLTVCSSSALIWTARITGRLE